MPGNKRARMPAVSVLIVNYDAGPNLARTLAGLVAQTFADFEALIIDNASNDRSIDMAQSQVPDDRRFKFTFLTRNIGFAAANNVIAATAQADWLALLNPDAVPTPDWLERLIEAAKRHPNAAMLGSTQIDADDPCRLDGAGDQYFALGIPWRGGYDWPVSDLRPEGEVFSR